MSKNVLIPLPLMHRIVQLLEYWDVSNYDAAIQLEHYDILKYLNVKKRKLDLRDDYANIIRAKNEDSRHEARVRYLQNKAFLRNDDLPF
jgi:hypothetical protein